MSALHVHDIIILVGLSCVIPSFCVWTFSGKYVSEVQGGTCEEDGQEGKEDPEPGETGPHPAVRTLAGEEGSGPVRCNAQLVRVYENISNTKMSNFSTFFPFLCHWGKISIRNFEFFFIILLLSKMLKKDLAKVFILSLC